MIILGHLITSAGNRNLIGIPNVIIQNICKKKHVQRCGQHCIGWQPSTIEMDRIMLMI